MVINCNVVWGVRKIDSCRQECIIVFKSRGNWLSTAEFETEHGANVGRHQPRPRPVVGSKVMAIN